MSSVLIGLSNICNEVLFFLSIIGDYLKGPTPDVYVLLLSFLLLLCGLEEPAREVLIVFICWSSTSYSSPPSSPFAMYLTCYTLSIWQSKTTIIRCVNPFVGRYVPPMAPRCCGLLGCFLVRAPVNKPDSSPSSSCSIYWQKTFFMCTTSSENLCI